jgi:pSer/pThr/pTyr-binding forkhead associated (FHA) protein
MMTALRVMEGPAKGKRFELRKDIVFLGRGTKNDIQVNDYTVSRMHLKIFRIGTAIFIEDLKSSNGTLINGRPLEPGEGRQIDEEDVITLGDTVLQLEAVFARKDPGSDEPAAESLEESEKTPSRFEAEERRLGVFRETELVAKLSELLRTRAKLGEIFESVAGQILTVLPRADRVAVFMRDRETGEIRKAAVKTKTDAKADSIRMPVVEEVVAEGRAVILADTTSGDLGDEPDEGATTQIKSLLCSPMTAHGVILGALYIDGIQGPYAYRKEDTQWIETAGTLVAYAIANAELSLRMSRIADLSAPKQEV